MVEVAERKQELNSCPSVLCFVCVDWRLVAQSQVLVDVVESDKSSILVLQGFGYVAELSTLIRLT